MKKVIYLYKSGTLSRQDYSLVLKDKHGYTHYIPIEQINTLICFGEININKRCLSLLNSYHISVLFFNFYGQYIGRFAPKKYLDGKLLIQQISAYQNEKERTHIANRMITASLLNCLSLMKYYNKKSFDLKKYILFIDEIIKELSDKNIDQMLLWEAQAKKKYYESFDIILQRSEFSFVKRSTRPPLNEINAMLSYGYSLLYANYLSVLDRSKLYSQISFIHSLAKNSESLQYDLADIMKPVIVDRLVLSLCRRNQIKKEYFSYNENRCYLNKEGAKFFVFQYEEYLKRTITIKNKSYSYRNLISREVHLLSNYLSGKDSQYKPYVMKW